MVNYICEHLLLAWHVLSVLQASSYRILKIIRKLRSIIPISKRKKFKFKEVNSLALSHRVHARARVRFPPLSTPLRLRGGITTRTQKVIII